MASPDSKTPPVMALLLFAALAIALPQPCASFDWNTFGFQSFAPAAPAPSSPFFFFSNPQTTTTITPKVVNGITADPTRYPYLVSLRKMLNGKNIHFCGGVLIAPDRVLTAAHCLDNPAHRFPEVHIGRYCQDECTGSLAQFNNYEVANTVASVQHPGWNPSAFYGGNDVAILRLNKNAKTKPVKVAAEDDAGKIWNFMSLRVIGLGMDQPGMLAGLMQQGDLPYRTNQDCRNLYSSAMSSGQLSLPPGFQVTDDMMCAGGFDTAACRGDSGGPLVISGNSPDADLVVGVVSFGVICGGPVSTPTIFTRLTEHEAFLRNEANVGPSNPPPAPKPPSSDDDDSSSSKPNPAPAPKPPPSVIVPPKASDDDDDSSSASKAITGDEAWPGQWTGTQLGVTYTIKPTMWCLYSKDYKLVEKVWTVQGCMQECSKTSFCKVFTYDEKNGNCFLKPECGEQKTNKDELSGFKVSGSYEPASSDDDSDASDAPNAITGDSVSQYSVHQGRECKGYSLSKHNNMDMASCQQKCNQNPNCAAVTLSDSNRCYLKAFCTLDSSSKDISAIRPRNYPVPTILNDVGCKDSTIKTYSNVPITEDCAEKCKNYSGCKAFTHNHKHNKCYLKAKCDKQETEEYDFSGFFYATI